MVIAGEASHNRRVQILQDLTCGYSLVMLGIIGRLKLSEVRRQVRRQGR